jgi:4'-phosphopantetheinyl transferase EntD
MDPLMRPLIADIGPPRVRIVETPTDVDAPLYPEEYSVVASAVEKRRREFTTGRWCARAALADLGIEPVPIATGRAGAPIWPDGVVGSITHCSGLRAAAVAHSRDFLALGIDAEPNEPLPSGVRALAASPSELSRLPRTPTVCWDRLLFCTKEAVYKAWYPLTQRFLRFDEANVTLHESGTFEAQLLVGAPWSERGPLRSIIGSWVARDDLVAALVAIPSPPAGSG